MLLRKPARLGTLLGMPLIAILLGGCQSRIIGIKPVVSQSLKVICLSRKDTEGTKRQVVEDNAAKRALGVPARKCK